MIKGTIHQEDLYVIGIYASDTGALTHKNTYKQT